MQIDTKYFLITCLLCHFLMLHKQILQKNYYWPKTLISQSQANNVKQTKMDRSMQTKMDKSMHTTYSQRLFPTSLSELHSPHSTSTLLYEQWRG